MELLNEYVGLLKDSGCVIDSTIKTIDSKDTLIVVDMQNDFLPGGPFGVAEGNQIVSHIQSLMTAFAEKGARIFATRDYHPINHCSFLANGGPFPPHCVQGTKGAELCDEIAETLLPLVQKDAATVVFKGFSRSIDSFGGFEYEDKEISERLSHQEGDKYCSSCWTGAFCLFSSNMTENVNAPPDVMSVLDRVSLKEKLSNEKKVDGQQGGRIFVVGLAFDYCVLDTAVNAAKIMPHSQVCIVVDCARAAHIPGVGTFGSGFLSDPRVVQKKLTENSVSLCEAKDFF